MVISGLHRVTLNANVSLVPRVKVIILGNQPELIIRKITTHEIAFHNYDL